jgi:hypothetical protein
VPYSHDGTQPPFSCGQGTQRLWRAINSAAAASNHPAARIFNAVPPHLGQALNHSPAANASLRGATVFFQLQSSHTNVKGLGFIGMNAIS